MRSKISKIITHIVEIPLKNTWEISLYSTQVRKHAIVEVITEEGIHGYGEASPSPAFMGETAETIKLVTDNYLAPAVVGVSVQQIALIHEKMNQAIFGNSAAKSALDIAVYDAWGKLMGCPVYELIGGNYRDKIPLTYVVGMSDPEAAYREAIVGIEAGFKVLKVKVGKDIQADLQLVKSIRQKIEESGQEVKIRLDANQGYTVPDALKVIRELESTGELEAVEQPIHKLNLLGLQEIRSQVDTPIMVDESVFNVEDAALVIQLGCADLINIKVCKVGGLYPAKKIAALAEAAGIPCTVGSNLELGLGVAASLHFVASTPIVQYASDFWAGIYLHEHDLIDGQLLDLFQDGQLDLLQGAGLGVDFQHQMTY